METTNLSRAEANAHIRKLKQRRAALTDPEQIKSINREIHLFEEYIHYCTKPDRQQDSIDRELDMLLAGDN